LVKGSLANGFDALAAMQDILYARQVVTINYFFKQWMRRKMVLLSTVLANPLGMPVSSFKAPSSEELDHDFFMALPNIYQNRVALGPQSFLL
jgi:hypothetical protein